MNQQIKKLASRFEARPGFVLQSNRFTQILCVTIVSVFLCTLFFMAKGWKWGIVEKLLVLTFCILLICTWLIHKKKPQYAIFIFISTITVLACSLIYQSLGLHDEAMIILPAVLLFACMFGTRLQFYLLLTGLIAFLGFVVMGHMQGWHKIPDVVDTNLSTFINVSVILITSGFFAFVLAGDLRKALTDLNVSKRDLLELNDQLESRVRQRTEQYESANKALHDSMEKLEHAMNELVHAEKLASLGSMVAGISHELNTPIGNTLLAASSMERMFDSVADKVDAGNFKRSAFEDFIKEGREMSSLITRSTKRAADLVVSFKQVAVDQTSEQRRIFDLKAVIDDNLSAMLPNFKKKEIQIVNTVPTGISCNSFPGPLGQILTNIVQNAILHGFDGNGVGTLAFFVDDQARQVILSINDDGKGMPLSVLSHVFDPFFTTKLGKGGSGLGLSISHRIATSVLGGDLRVESSLGNGATFILVIPKVAPFPI